MKKPVFNHFRKNPEKPPEKVRHSRKKRVFGAAYNAAHQHHKENDAKKRFRLPSFKGFKFPKLSKKTFTSVVAIAIVAVSVPVIFAAASGTNEVAKITEIDLASPAPSSIPEDTSGLFDGVAETGPKDPTTDGELTSDLTETTTDAAPQADPAPTPIPRHRIRLPFTRHSLPAWKILLLPSYRDG